MTEEEAIDNILKSCGAMGWQIAMPDSDSESEVDGLVIGKKEYIEKILSDEFGADTKNEGIELESSPEKEVKPKSLIAENPCLPEDIRTDRYNKLSVSWDYDADANDRSQRRVVLLHVPDTKDHEHEHIELTLKQTVQLKDWLERFIKFTCK